MKSWGFDYKGHRVEIKNSFSGEHLVDGQMQDEGIGLAVHSRLYGRIPNEEGAEEQIKVSLGGWFTIGCIVFINDREVYRS